MSDIHPACARCKGACCEQVHLATGSFPLDEARWLELHGTRTLIGVVLDVPCGMLTDEGKCGIYSTRPKLCREYEVGGKQCRKAIKRRRVKEEAEVILGILNGEVDNEDF